MTDQRPRTDKNMCGEGQLVESRETESEEMAEEEEEEKTLQHVHLTRGSRISKQTDAFQGSHLLPLITRYHRVFH